VARVVSPSPCLARRGSLAALTGLLALLLLAAQAARGADPLGPGDRFPDVSLEDQHGVSHTIDAGVRRVVFSRDMDAGRVAKAALEDDGAALLDRSDAVYVSDIARMPALVSKLFALPGMRRRPYPILLDFDGETTARWPAFAGRPALITLRGGVIVEVEAFEDAGDLRGALEAGAAPLSVQEEIVHLEQRRYRALVGADAVALDVLLDPELVYTHSSGLVQGKADLIGSLEDGRLDYRNAKSRVEGLSVVGDTAIVTGRAELGVAAEGRSSDVVVRYTAVYARRDGRWRLVAYQSTALDEP
jgi:hypothetical protein